VWFLTVNDPATGRGYWIRSSLLGPKKGAPAGGVWFARFDPVEPSSTFGIHGRFPVGEGSVQPDRFDVRIGNAVMSSGHASGSLRDPDHEVRWELEWPTGEPTYRPLPDRLYRGGLAVSKPYAPNVVTRATGLVSVDGDVIELRSAPAHQGHVSGRRHAERWAWAHCADFVEEEAVVEALTAQQRRGPLLTPFVTFVGVRWDGRWIRLGGVSRRRDFGLGWWKVDLASRRHRLTGRIEAPARALIRARYQDPDGRPRFCHNSEISSCRLALFERRAGGFDEIALLESRGTTHAEWAGRTPATQVERAFSEVGMT
jgi:hypothetical protein